MKSSIDEVINLLNNKKFGEAKDILENMACSDPKNPEILYNLGMCYSELGDFNTSIKTLNQALNYKPEGANILTALSFSLIKLGLIGEAEKALNKALEIEPNNLYAINNLGGLYGKMGKYDLALKIYECGEAIYPDDPRLIYGLALSHQKLGNFDKADAYFRKLVKREIPDAYTELAKTGLREIAHEEFKKKGLRPDAVMYCVFR
jgi:tetratricopeptide (TPR) repeat protein